MHATSTDQASLSTFGNEDDLPRVPLPALEDSTARFLTWCAPLLTPEELATTREAVDAVLAPDSPARRLHAALEAYDASDGVHSWVDAFWRDRYLGRRDRIALNANFFFLFQDDGEGQLRRAAGLVAAALDHKAQLDAERLPPALQQGRPLSMEQHRYVYSAVRIPGAVRDTLRSPYSADWPGPSRERHIVVFCRGQAFRMDVLGPDGSPHPPDELEAGLRAVLASATGAAPDTSVGHLTTQARAAWATSRQALLDADPGNAGTLDVIETALFCLCLEDLVPQDVQQACDQLLHGDSGNRFFDKPLSFIVFGNGTAGVNIEHSKLDGTTVLDLVDALLTGTPEEHAERAGAAAQGEPTYEPLTFVLDDALRSEVREAGAAFAAYAADTVTSVVSFADFGTDDIKALKTSPDAFVQLAYQLAHHRTRGVGATYESIATRQYHHGRTEAMRVVTYEVLEFVAAMSDPEVDADARRAALRAAAAVHVERAGECRTGRAPEQHLWELELLQRRRGEELGVTEPLALYSSPGWLVMRDDDLSTSSAPSTNIQHFGFGSTSPRCIGIAYVLLPGRFNLYLSATRQAGDALAVFATELRTAVAELRALLGGQG